MKESKRISGVYMVILKTSQPNQAENDLFFLFLTFIWICERNLKNLGTKYMKFSDEYIE